MGSCSWTLYMYHPLSYCFFFLREDHQHQYSKRVCINVTRNAEIYKKHQTSGVCWKSNHFVCFSITIFIIENCSWFYILIYSLCNYVYWNSLTMYSLKVGFSEFKKVYSIQIKFGSFAVIWGSFFVIPNIFDFVQCSSHLTSPGYQNAAGEEEGTVSVLSSLGKTIENWSTPGQCT